MRLASIGAAVAWWGIVIPAGDRDDPAIDIAAGARGAPLGRDDAHAYVRDAYDSHQRDIYSFALHTARDPDVAADVTQDAFLRLLTEAERHGPPENLKAWLIRVSVNLIISRGRRVSVADRWVQRFSHHTESAESPEAGLLRHERRDRVEALLQSVQPDARMCLLMAAEGFSGREIAAAIGRTEPATRVLMSRARNHLRGVLAADDHLIADRDSGAL
jgi:RNA polymerase sigma-70 factor, ECF subfamily